MSEEKKESFELTAEELDSVAGGLPAYWDSGGCLKSDDPRGFVGHKVHFKVDGKTMTGTVSGIKCGSCSMFTLTATIQVQKTKSYFFGLIKKHYTEDVTYRVDSGNLIGFEE